MPTPALCLASAALLAVLLAAAEADRTGNLQGLQAALRREGQGAVRDSSSAEEDEDAGPGPPPTLDEHLAAALRECMDHYVADRGTVRVRGIAQPCRRDSPPRRGGTSSGPAPERDRGRGRRGVPGGGSDSVPRGADGAGGARVAAIRSWVTYYGELPAMLPPGAANGGGPGQALLGDASVCAVHCAFVRTQLVSRAGLPDESLLSKRLEDSIEEPRRRLAAMRNAALCFARLGAVREADADVDPCQYTTKLAKCMDMQVMKEYARMKQNKS